MEGTTRNDGKREMGIEIFGMGAGWLAAPWTPAFTLDRPTMTTTEPMWRVAVLAARTPCSLPFLSTQERVGNYIID